MAYPVTASNTIGPSESFAVPFRPVVAGLVKAVVNATGVLPAPTGIPGEVNPSPIIGIQVDLLKPGSATPVVSNKDTLILTSGLIPDKLVVWDDTPAEAADLSADWTVRITNLGNVPAGCNVTVRYQVVPGNLGKVDHIVVLMMENRSFDHMLGYLSLPAPEGPGRTDVDGLTGSEFNEVEPPPPVLNAFRPLPIPATAYPVFALADTTFHTDPGHGWNDVAVQLSAGPPALISNAGFAANFVHQLNIDTQNSPPLLGTVHDQTRVDIGGARSIAFRPGVPGPINISAAPLQPPATSESGLIAKVFLVLPSNRSVSVKEPLGVPLVHLEYQVTAADLATPGDWICRVENETEVAITFTTDISWVQAPHDTTGLEPVSSIMGYHTAAHLPMYDLLASQFAICDRWFASLPTDTWPNRLYGLTGGSGGVLDTPPDGKLISNPPGFTLTTIFEVLQSHGVDWINYFSDLPFALIFQNLARDAQYTQRMRSITQFMNDAIQGNLPSVSWLDPNFTDVPDGTQFANDDHPPGDVTPGQLLVSQIYTALTKSPDWTKTLLVVTYDEHGGFYDHVLPPGTPLPVPPSEPPLTVPAAPGGPPDDLLTLRRYGVRVPAFVVSPWTEPAFVSHETYDHTSIVSTILRRFCADGSGQVPNMGQRAAAANDLGSILFADTPRETALAAPPVSPAPAVIPVFDPGSFGAVLRKIIFGF